MHQQHEQWPEKPKPLADDRHRKYPPAAKRSLSQTSTTIKALRFRHRHSHALHAARNSNFHPGGIPAVHSTAPVVQSATHRPCLRPSSLTRSLIQKSPRRTLSLHLSHAKHKITILEAHSLHLNHLLHPTFTPDPSKITRKLQKRSKPPRNPNFRLSSIQARKITLRIRNWKENLVHKFNSQLLLQYYSAEEAPYVVGTALRRGSEAEEEKQGR
ncbi:hypothetical protein M758_5G086800 [Ceratodon purpureus]|nr:hypothetical protein M758_5G086800 [Ceratodon purpureus]